MASRPPVCVLTPQNLRVLEETGTGASSKEIAARLGVGEQTIKNHMIAIRRKLGVHTTIGALRAMGWIRLPSDANDRSFQLRDLAEHLLAAATEFEAEATTKAANS